MPVISEWKPLTKASLYSSTLVEFNMSCNCFIEPSRSSQFDSFSFPTKILFTFVNSFSMHLLEAIYQITIYTRLHFVARWCKEYQITSVLRILDDVVIICLKTKYKSRKRNTVFNFAWTRSILKKLLGEFQKLVQSRPVSECTPATNSSLLRPVPTAWSAKRGDWILFTSPWKKKRLKH